jgi:hypothetical protein
VTANDHERCGELIIDVQQVGVLITLDAGARAPDVSDNAGDDIGVKGPQRAVGLDVPIVPRWGKSDELVGA